MLTSYIKQAIQLGAERLEIEHKDREYLVTAFRGCLGVGLGAVDSSRSRALFREIAMLKKQRKLTLSGKTQRLVFSTYESFGDAVHVIAFRPTERA